MKKILLLLSFMSATLGINAQSQVGNLTISELELAPGGESGYIYVGLENSDITYASYSLDIMLPEAIDVCLDEDGLYDVYFDDDDSDLYPYTRKSGYSHMISGNVIRLDGHKALRVFCGDPVTGKAFEQNNGRLFYVQIKANPFMKPGKAQIEIRNIALVEQTGTKHVPTNPQVDVTINNTSKTSFNVSAANRWSTCILPFAIEIPDGVKAYTSSTFDNENIYLNEAERIEAYRPYILYSENGYTGFVCGTVNPADYPESGYVTAGNLSGAIVPQTVTEGFILQKHNDNVKFYAIDENDSFLVPAGKCWMNIPEGGGVKAFNFVVDNDETGIQTALDMKRNSDIYDLTGRRVSTMKKNGLYIKNGEKILNK